MGDRIACASPLSHDGTLIVNRKRSGNGAGDREINRTEDAPAQQKTTAENVLSHDVTFTVNPKKMQTTGARVINYGESAPAQQKTVGRTPKYRLSHDVTLIVNSQSKGTEGPRGAAR